MYRPFADFLPTLVIAATLGLAACSSTPRQPTPAATQSAATTAQGADPAAALVEPPEAVAAFERAMQHMSAGDAATAERELKDLSEKYPTYAGPLVNLAILQAKAGRHSEAEASLKEAISRNSNSAPAHNQLGILYRKLGRFKEANDAYERAVQSDPGYALAHLNLGVLCDLYLGQPERALQSFERYLQLEGNPQPQVQTWVKELRSRLGQQVPAAESKPQESAEPQAGSGA